MMRDDDDDDEEFARPPAPHEQHFNSKIEAALGYEISDPILRDEIHEDIYNPKPKAEFGFDPTVEGAGSPDDAPLVKLADYAANTGNLQETEDGPTTNLLAAQKGYVMSSNQDAEAANKDIEKEVGEKFGGAIPQDEEEEEEGGHTPYQQLDTVDEGSEDSYVAEPENKPKPKKNKRASDIGGGMKDRIMVSVRFRPMTKEEMVSKSKKKMEQGGEAFMAWTVEEDGGVDVIMQKGQRSRVEGKNMFHVDQVFEEQDHTEAVYSNMCSPIMTAVMNGQHGTIFGYGQTGGGKSYTIQGGKKGNGVIQLAAKDLFERIAEDTEREYNVKACYFEVYNEQVRDLMGYEESDDVKSRRGTAVIMTVNKLNVDLPVLNIREDSKGGDVFVDAQYTPVANVAGVTRVLHKGNRNRATEKTDSNEFSSRSHAIFRLTVESHERVEGEAEVVEGVKVRVAALNFVDLAGSENSAKANTSGSRKREGGKINQSLLSLTQVINQLSMPEKKRPKFINYRDSKLTRLLQPHLSGNAAISILCCCSPAKKVLEETRSTLKFAFNAKRIKLQPQVNEIVDDRVLVDNLRKELHETRLRLKELKEQQANAPPPPPPAPSGPEFPLIERFMAQMNMSVATADFMDAIEELSNPSGLGDADGGAPAVSAAPKSSDGQAAGGGGDAPPAASAPEPAPNEDDEDEIEAFRRQILAKFMNMDDDEFDGDGDGDGGNADAPANDTTINDTTAADTTMGDTTMADTTVNDTTMADTTVDTSLNQTFVTEDTNANQADNKENQPAPQSPPPIARKEPETAANANEVFRSKPDAQPAPAVKPPEPSPLPLVSPAINVAPRQAPVNTVEDSSSRDPPDESDLNLIEKFRSEILEKFRDEIVDEEAAHELDENAQNVAVIANELINKFKREIVYKYKDEFPEILVKRVEVDLAATRVGDNGIVGRVIERGTVGVDSSDDRLNTDDSSNGSGGSVERFEDEFDEEGKLGGEDDAATADKPEPRGRGVPARTYSTQTDRAVINGKGLLRGIAPSRSETQPTTIPINSQVGIGASGSVSSDLSSDVAEKEKEGSGISPVPANPPSDDGGDYMIPLGEIAVKNGTPEVSLEGRQRIKFLEDKLVATDELVETLFVELENAKTFIRELVFENAGGGKSDPSGAALFGPAGTSGVTVVDEQILNQCEILKFAIYTSLLFFVFGQHELFLATVFFLWLSLEVATKT